MCVCLTRMICEEFEKNVQELVLCFALCVCVGSSWSGTDSVNVSWNISMWGLGEKWGSFSKDFTIFKSPFSESEQEGESKAFMVHHHPVLIDRLWLLTNRMRTSEDLHHVAAGKQNQEQIQVTVYKHVRWSFIRIK